MKILLPLDHSDYSKAAVAAVRAQVPPKGNEVRVLHVVEALDAYFGRNMTPIMASHAAAIVNDRRKRGKKLLDEAVRALRKAGFRTSTEMESGEPKEQILKAADRWPADLIVLGSHGLRGFTRLLLGSISEAVMRHAHCSVEIVRAPQAAEPAKKRRAARSRRR